MKSQKYLKRYALKFLRSKWIWWQWADGLLLNKVAIIGTDKGENIMLFSFMNAYY